MQAWPLPLEVNQKSREVEESRNIKVATIRWAINSFVAGEAGGYVQCIEIERIQFTMRAHKYAPKAVSAKEIAC